MRMSCSKIKAISSPSPFSLPPTLPLSSSLSLYLSIICPSIPHQPISPSFLHSPLSSLFLPLINPSLSKPLFTPSLHLLSLFLLVSVSCPSLSLSLSPPLFLFSIPPCPSYSLSLSLFLIPSQQEEVFNWGRKSFKELLV